MGEKILPSPELLRQLLCYESETGKLYWKARPKEMFDSGRIWKSWNAKNAGKEAFTAIRNGMYRCGNIFNQTHQAHRVIWAIFYGSWPESEIDHENLDKLDNRISNLRIATRTENLRNIRRFSSNTSGYKGVSRERRTGKWVARISTGKEYKHLGSFLNKEDARAAYVDAAIRYHGGFVNYD